MGDNGEFEILVLSVSGIALIYYLCSPKVCTEGEFLQFGGCSQVQSVALVAKAEGLGNPGESCSAQKGLMTLQCSVDEDWVGDELDMVTWIYQL